MNTITNTVHGNMVGDVDRGRMRQTTMTTTLCNTFNPEKVKGLTLGDQTYFSYLTNIVPESETGVTKFVLFIFFMYPF